MASSCEKLTPVSVLSQDLRFIPLLFHDTEHDWWFEKASEAEYEVFWFRNIKYTLLMEVQLLRNWGEGKLPFNWFIIHYHS